MVVEFLTFEVDPAERDEWLRVEESVWSRFLETVPGFVSKQMWVERDEPAKVHAVIVWRDDQSWAAVGAERCAEVDARMGTWFRDATCRTFDIVRDC